MGTILEGDTVLIGGDNVQPVTDIDGVRGEEANQQQQVDIPVFEMVDVAVTEEIQQMKKNLGDTFDETRYCNADLLRFLRARKGNVNEATVMFANYVEWANNYKPWNIKLSDIKNMAELKIAHYHYCDKQGRPCLVVHSARHRKKERDLQEAVRYVLFMVEHGIRCTGRPDNKLVVIFDYHQFSSSNSDLELAKELIGLMNKYFPERLEVVFLYNYPWALSVILSIVEPLLDPVTRKKVNMVKKKEIFLQYFDECHLLPEHGGTSTYAPGQFLLGFETINRKYAEQIESQL